MMTMTRWILMTLLVLTVANAQAGQIVLADQGERPPVVFDHDLHTEALAVDGRPDCKVCHSQDTSGSLDLTVPAAVDPAAHGEAPHQLCGDCHVTMNRGPHPSLCASCHAKDVPEPAGNLVSGLADFDHDAHIGMVDDDCARCHHIADPDSGRLMPADGEEAGCADCHVEDNKLPSLQMAAHTSCIGCHVGEDGPVTCMSCHGVIKDQLK